MAYSELHFPPRNSSRGQAPFLPLLGASGAFLSHRALVGMESLYLLKAHGLQGAPQPGVRAELPLSPHGPSARTHP